MKIGDKVRFLNEIGGGKVAGFQKNNIVLIEDEDGFQIPMNMKEVVVVDNESDKKQSQKVSTSSVSRLQTSEGEERDYRSIKSLIGDGYSHTDEDLETEEDYDPADMDITFEKPVEERLGGNSLHVYLCFVPKDIKTIGQTTYDTYLVNDSNYYVHYTYSTKDDQVWWLRSHGEIAPNTQLFIEEIKPEETNDIEHAAVQLLAFKRKKDYVLKPAIDVNLRIEPLTFYKLHAYQDNDFFHSKALIYAIVENDEAYTQPQESINADKVKEEMMQKKMNENLKVKLKGDQQAAAQQAKGMGKGADNGLVVVDLHADKLLESTGGMSSVDILQYQLEVFRNTIKAYAKQKGTRIVFIHGKGEGVLRRAILNELNYRYKSYQYQDASFQEYGYGATQVTIK